MSARKSFVFSLAGGKPLPSGGIRQVLLLVRETARPPLTYLPRFL
jgi:hypothetical protein